MYHPTGRSQVGTSKLPIMHYYDYDDNFVCICSMIPTHFMGGIQSHHHILDMCACMTHIAFVRLAVRNLSYHAGSCVAPGSKTLQLLSALHGQDQLRPSTDSKSNGDILPTGTA
jgi:hypothetical protein